MTTLSQRPDTVEFLRDLVEELRAEGFVADSVRSAGHSGALVAPSASEAPGGAR